MFGNAIRWVNGFVKCQDNSTNHCNCWTFVIIALDCNLQFPFASSHPSRFKCVAYYKYSWLYLKINLVCYGLYELIGDQTQLRMSWGIDDDMLEFLLAYVCPSFLSVYNEFYGDITLSSCWQMRMRVSLHAGTYSEWHVYLFRVLIHTRSTALNYAHSLLLFRDWKYYRVLRVYVGKCFPIIPPIMPR